MALAGVGPLTSAIETVATAVAASTLLGSFAVGAVGLLTGKSRKALAARALTDGYAGGILGAVAVLLDLFLRYGG